MIDSLPPYLHSISVPTPFPVGPVNLYLAEGDPLTLVDTGPRFDPARDVLRRELAALGYQPSDLGRIVITHTHSDHCGLAAELVSSSGAEVATHPANFDALGDYASDRASRLAFYAALMQEAGVPLEVMLQIDETRRGYGQFAQAVGADRALEEGGALLLGSEEWLVLHTPGHTGGLICLHQPQRRLLLSSDHLLRDVSSNPIIEPPAREGTPRPRRLLDYVAQLQRVALLPLETALPGHGPPITDPRRLISSRLAFHERRARQVLAVLRDGARTVFEITLALFPRVDPINRFLAVSEVIGHLDWLEERGEAVSELEGVVRMWQLRPIRAQPGVDRLEGSAE